MSGLISLVMGGRRAVAGGLRLTDPGADLAVAMSVYSAVMNRPVPEGVALVGEVGLAGEIRSVGQLPRRVQEAKRSGMAAVLGPAGATVDRPARDLREALAHLWGPDR